MNKGTGYATAQEKTRRKSEVRNVGMADWPAASHYHHLVVRPRMRFLNGFKHGNLLKNCCRFDREVRQDSICPRSFKAEQTFQHGGFAVQPAIGGGG